MNPSPNTFPFDIDSLPVDDEKKEAIRTTEGPLLIIAGPGSGKTRTLVERIINLISKGIAPEEIMVATFTEKAAKELITRVSNRLLELNLKVNLNEMYIGTLHSIFLRVLEEHREFTRLKRSYRILDDFDQKFFVYERMSEFMKIKDIGLQLGIPKGSFWWKAQNVVKTVNTIAEESLDPEVLAKAAPPDIRVMGEMGKLYRSMLEEQNVLDFSTIQVEVLHLLEENPEVLTKIREKVRYLMIDEYQDTNTIQEKILFLLAGESQNICVVGDDDQGLYRFRGATIRNILEFPSNFSNGNCKKVTLITNYRSHPRIINFFGDWIDTLDWKENGQTFRFEKEIKPRQDITFPKYPSVIKLGKEGELEEWYKEVLDFILKLEEEEILKDRNQIAFLFNSIRNDKVTGLARYLEENGVDVFNPRSKLFFERPEVMLVLGAIIFIFPNLFEVLNYDPEDPDDTHEYFQSCKRAFAEAIRADMAKHKHLLQWAQTKAKSHLTLQKATTYAFAGLVYQLLEYPLFAEYVDADLDGKKTGLRAAYNVALLTKLLYKFEYLFNATVIKPSRKNYLLNALFNKYFRFLIQGGIDEFEDSDEYAPSGCVSFLTIHQSKGLEFPIVVVGSLESVPRKQFSDTDQILQEEFYHKPPFEPIEQTKYYDFWRLYYTAFSRAQNLLVLTAKENRGPGRKVPTKYFQGLYDNLPAWREVKWNKDRLVLDEIKATNLKREYSFTSHVLLYENCPTQYKFYKELEFTEVRKGGMLGGTLLHQTIEDIHKAVLRKEEHRLTDEQITTWFETNYYLLAKRERTYLQEGQRKALLRQVLGYRDRQQGNWHRILEAEVEVSLVKEDFILKGTIDLIEGEENSVEIIDFKSGDKPELNSRNEYDRNAIDGFRRQLEVYAHLVEERTGKKVSRMHLYFPKEQNGNPYITFAHQPQRIDETISSFQRIVKKIENKDFDASHVTKNDKQCGNCDMRFHCNPSQYTK